MIAVAGYAAATLTLAGCAIYAALTWGDEHGRDRRGFLRRAAWRIRYGRGLRIPGLPADGEPLQDWERAAFLDIASGWRRPGRTERSRG